MARKWKNSHSWTAKRSRENPKGVKLRPTPEEAQAFVAEKERKKLEDERWRQRAMEDDLKHQLKSRLDEKKFKAQQKKKMSSLYAVSALVL